MSFIVIKCSYIIVKMNAKPKRFSFYFSSIKVFLLFVVLLLNLGSKGAKGGGVKLCYKIGKLEAPMYFLLIYIIKELVLKQCSKFYASGGNVAKLRG
jgi:hypothetical protein